MTHSDVTLGWKIPLAIITTQTSVFFTFFRAPGVLSFQNFFGNPTKATETLDLDSYKKM
jgi:hypothetical protein